MRSRYREYTQKAETSKKRQNSNLASSKSLTSGILSLAGMLYLCCTSFISWVEILTAAKPSNWL
ncbi:MAG: hypothetical protein ACFKPT_01055 [Gloeotrichia echinulata GP01]